MYKRTYNNKEETWLKLGQGNERLFVCMGSEHTYYHLNIGKARFSSSYISFKYELDKSWESL